MIVKYKIEDGSDIEDYIGHFCSTYPDTETINLLRQLSTRSLVKAYLYAKEKKHYSNYYKNLTYHLFISLGQRNNIINGVLLYDFQDDSHLQKAPHYINL